MDDILQRFEKVLQANDLVRVPAEVEQLLKIYVTRSASPKLRHDIIMLLRRKASESSSHALTGYLRSVADCIEEQESPPATQKCVEEQRPLPKDATRKSPTPRMTKLGEFLRSQRPETPIP